MVVMGAVTPRKRLGGSRRRRIAALRRQPPSTRAQIPYLFLRVRVISEGSACVRVCVRARTRVATGRPSRHVAYGSSHGRGEARARECSRGVSSVGRVYRLPLAIGFGRAPS